MAFAIKTDALIIKAFNYKEADQLLTVYSEKLGKITVLVRGARKLKSHLRAGTILFSYSKLGLVKGKSFYIATHAEAIETFMELRGDLATVASASYLAELLDAFVPEGEPDDYIFGLLLRGLYGITQVDNWVLLRAIELKLLARQGFFPELNKCAVCGMELKREGFFSSEEGGIVCIYCLKEDESGYIQDGLFTIKGETRRLLQSLMEMEITKIGRLRFSPGAKGETEAILDDYLSLRSGRRFKSKKFLKQFTD